MTINQKSEYQSITDLLKIGDELSASQIATTPLDLPIQLNKPSPIKQSETKVNSPGEKDTMEQGLKKLVLSGFRFFHIKWFIFPAIFLASFIFFYVALNFSALISQVEGWFTKPQAQQILGDQLTDYYAWISGYYFWVSDRALLEPTNDLDGDGLSNMDEYIVRTSPIVADSDQDGIRDGIEVINFTNFWGSGPLTGEETKLVSDLDLIKINNRITYNAFANLISSDGKNVLGVSKINYDLSRQGTLSIPKLNLQVPIIWSNSPNDFENDLTKGVIHYPGTSLPGEIGVMYISGHSSGYPWKKSSYKEVFARLNALDIGDDVFVDIYDVNGKIINFRYRVSDEGVYKPDDQAQFVTNDYAKLNLSTCWPIGTQKDRYVVSAILQNL